MTNIRIVQDPVACRDLWERLWPQTGLFDLWPVRACFMNHYQRPPLFVTEEHPVDHPPLFMALAWIEEGGYFGHFPGETWQGKTWLEQNKLIGVAGREPEAIMEKVPGSVSIRYLDENYLFPATDPMVDEVGYLFIPAQYDFSFAAYRGSFPGKTRKKFDREIGRLQENSITWRHDDPADVERMMKLNLSAFGERSYFFDTRFLHGFIDLIAFLKQNNMLRITSILIGGRLAAVDVGALWNHTYTVLAGGTDPEFPGVAKLINFHHIEWACRQRLALVDFLCGDFAWKSRFRLQPRPLFKFCFPASAANVEEAPARDTGVHCAA